MNVKCTAFKNIIIFTEMAEIYSVEYSGVIYTSIIELNICVSLAIGEALEYHVMVLVG